MKESIISLISELKSPLFRIMTGYDIQDSTKRRFENNICAFHIGKGYFLSVSHNLIRHTNILQSIDESIFQNHVLQGVTTQDRNFLNANYSLDTSLNKLRWNGNNNNRTQLIQTFSRIPFDIRYPNIYSNNICKPYLIVQFKANSFFDDPNLTSRFSDGRNFHESNIKRYTFLIDLEIVQILHDSDITIYKITDEFIDLNVMIPSLPIDFEFYDIGYNDCYCLQGAPINELGKLLNKANIDGVIDHFSSNGIVRGQNYIFQGNRYLIKGYFRFGSSGAPYLSYDRDNDEFSFNAIQSEASPLQMLINGNRNNNAQYVNAIATPLQNVQQEIEEILS